MASLIEYTNNAIYAALAADSALETAIGVSGRIQRGYQGAKITVPGIVYQIDGQQKLLAEVTEPRRVDVLISCYHGVDLGSPSSCASIAEAAFAVLNDNVTLTATGSKIYFSDCTPILGAPIWSEPERAYRQDFHVEVYLRAD